MEEKVRVDKYLWAIRVFKTRNLAKDACDGGKVKLHGKSLKPAYNVNIGDVYEIKTSNRDWEILVTGLIGRRVSYELSLNYYKDQTPEEKKQKQQKQTASFYTGKRLSKTGKPTKKQRRDLENFLDL